MAHPDEDRTDPWAGVEADERPSRTVIDLPTPSSFGSDDAGHAED